MEAIEYEISMCSFLNMPLLLVVVFCGSIFNSSACQSSAVQDVGLSAALVHS